VTGQWLLSGSALCSPMIWLGPNQSITVGRTNDRSPVSDAPDLPVRFREEFRTPLGVRKSPKNEPAGCRVGLWGFDDLAVQERAVAAAWGLCGTDQSGMLLIDHFPGPKRSVDKCDDNFWGRQPDRFGRGDGHVGCGWPMPFSNGLVRT
jgi:hypothetical protein